MKIYGNILENIGNTPIIKINRLDCGFCELFLKLESQNPGSSIKDRIALSMVNAAEKDGLIHPGDEIIEATAGNTGLGLALVARVKNYRLTLVIPDKMSSEKIQRLKSMGANIVMTRSDVEKGHPEYYQDMAKELAGKRGTFYIDQFNNPANPKAHETTTAPEIWEQMGGDVDAVVIGVGSSGTMTGLTAFFKKTKPDLELVLADPKGSILSHYVNTGQILDHAGSWLVEGIGEDFIPGIADFSMVKKAYEISDKESFDTARELLVKEGIFAGSSSGTLLAAALKYCRAQSSPKKVLTFVCDSGGNYLTKMYNEFWMKDRGLLGREKHGDLRDFVFRRYKNNEIITGNPRESLRKAYFKMKENNISQLPVLENDQVVGVLAESDLLFALISRDKNFAAYVEDAMAKNVVSIKWDASESELLDILNQDFVAIVEDKDGTFYGIITKIDYLTYLELKHI
jgi:cystathionine beta-synthase